MHYFVKDKMQDKCFNNFKDDVLMIRFKNEWWWSVNINRKRNSEMNNIDKSLREKMILIVRDKL